MIKPIKSLLIPEPLGLVLIIGPWNYPFALTLVPLISAVAAGNCVVIKPSEHCTHSSNIIEKIISQTFDKNHVSVVQGDVKVSETLLKWPWNHLFFTGSTDVGKKVMLACSQHLTPVTLELGGKNPCIVYKEIDIVKTARRIIWGKFFNAGQTCIAPDYLWIHKSLTKNLIPEIERTIKQFYGENPQNSPYYARIINRAHHRRLTEFIKTNQVLLGGHVEEDDLYIAPTLLKDINWDCKIMQSEIFGPILPVMEYDTIEEVIATLQERPSALTCHLFTNDNSIQNKVREGVQSGSICFNTTFSQVMNRNLPFGGVGASGMGKYFAKAGFDTFSHYRAVVRKNFLWESSLVYPPYKIDLKTFKRIIPWIN